MTLVRDVAGMAALAGLHDAVLLDQFGVLHDGARAFPGAVDCVTRLRAGGARIAIVSNSGKRAAPNRARLAALGFAPSLFDAVITSGEICRDLLAAEIAAGRLAQGGRIFVLARGADRSALEGLDLRATSDPTDADALLIAGAEPERCALEAYAALLAPLAARRAPCFCANPDLRMYAASGVTFGAGAVAQAYAAAGGPVRWIGKPGAEMFAAALAALGVGDPARAVMVGDSVAHDVAGAAAVGCGWALIADGVYVGAAQDDDPSRHGPGWRMARFVW